MDSQFLKFWGKLLLQAAAGRRWLEDLDRWMPSGAPPRGELADLFRQCYGLPKTASPANHKQWQSATAAFHAALEAYAPLWGWVPLERYDQLQRKTERLETTVAEQTRLIEQYQTLLEDRGMGPMTMITRFQNVIDDQSQAFEKLMEALAPLSEAPDAADH
jgi:hypothetical protein